MSEVLPRAANSQEIGDLLIIFLVALCPKSGKQMNCVLSEDRDTIEKFSVAYPAEDSKLWFQPKHGGINMEGRIKYINIYVNLD